MKFDIKKDKQIRIDFFLNRHRNVIEILLDKLASNA